jgi:hypothetical protein
MNAPQTITRFAVLVAACVPLPAPALDALFMRNEDPRLGRVESISEAGVRIRVPLAPRRGSPPDAETVFSTLLVPRAEISRIEFQEDPALVALLAAPRAENRSALEAQWKRWEPYLGLPKAPSGMVGTALGEALLLSDDPADANRALEIFTRIEARTWDERAIMRARQGRLRAMIATGNAAAAVGEAMELEKITEDPAVIVEAKYILANAAENNLRTLIEENPRWEEDIWIIPERDRLLNEALDEYLYPYLFFGSKGDAAARGLRGAMGVYEFVGDLTNARECARDLLAFYPESRDAEEARKFLSALPEDLLAEDPEQEAREAHGSPPPDPEEKSNS